MDLKEIQLLKLAKKRQELRYDGYGAISDYNDGIWECDYISPYSKSAHNVNADVVVILQDWCSESSFGASVCAEDLKLGYTPKVGTNKNLITLLEKHLNLNLSETYATNLFPYIKKGAMSALIPMKDLVKAATDFTIPLLDIIKPKIAICLGLNTFNSLRSACGLKAVYPMDSAIKSPFMHNGTKIFAQAHTSQQGINNRNKGDVNRVSTDWDYMAGYLRLLQRPVTQVTTVGNKKGVVSEKITIFELSSSDSFERLISALENGSTIEISSCNKRTLVWKNGKEEIEEGEDFGTVVVKLNDSKLINLINNQELNKKEFLRYANQGMIHVQRKYFKPPFIELSDTQIARKIGDTSRTLTMAEMNEKGIDVWGS